MIYIVLKDIKSYANRNLTYAKKGERVAIISEHEEIVCVISESGNKFSCNIKKLKKL